MKWAFVLLWRVYGRWHHLARRAGLVRIRVRGRTLESYFISLAAAVVPRFLPSPLRVNGLRLYYPRSKFGYLSILAPEGYEPEVTQLVGRLVVPGANVIDAGAGIGYYTLLFAQAAGPSGHVWAFEPEPDNYAMLKKNVAANGYEDRVTAVAEALSNKSGCAELFCEEWHMGVHSFFAKPGVRQHAVKVKTASVDEFFASEGWPMVSLVKMDIEGAEKVALEGMRELSGRNGDLKLILEVNPATLEAAGVRAEELLEALHKLGFSRFSLLSTRREGSSVQHGWARELAEFGNWLCEKG